MIVKVGSEDVDSLVKTVEGRHEGVFKVAEQVPS